MAVRSETGIESELRRAAGAYEEGKERRDRAIRKAARQGLTRRHIASLVDLSHQRVDQIIRSSRT